MTNCHCNIVEHQIQTNIIIVALVSATAAAITMTTMSIYTNKDNKNNDNTDDSNNNTNNRHTLLSHTTTNCLGRQTSKSKPTTKTNQKQRTQNQNHP